MAALAVTQSPFESVGTERDSRPRFWHVQPPSGMRQKNQSVALLYQRYGPTVFRRACQILGNDMDAREVVQDVFLALFEDPDQFRGKSSISTFLYSATTHACLNRVRNQQNRERLTRDRFAYESDETDPRLSPEQLSMLHRALERMPEELAQVAVYYLVDGLTHDEIAGLLSCSRRHVGNLLQRLEAWGSAEEAG